MDDDVTTGQQLRARFAAERHTFRRTTDTMDLDSRLLTIIRDHVQHKPFDSNDAFAALLSHRTPKHDHLSIDDNYITCDDGAQVHFSPAQIRSMLLNAFACGHLIPLRHGRYRFKHG